MLIIANGTIEHKHRVNPWCHRKNNRRRHKGGKFFDAKVQKQLAKHGQSFFLETDSDFASFGGECQWILC